MYSCGEYQYWEWKYKTTQTRRSCSQRSKMCKAIQRRVLKTYRHGTLMEKLNQIRAQSITILVKEHLDLQKRYGCRPQSASRRQDQHERSNNEMQRHSKKHYLHHIFICLFATHGHAQYVHVYCKLQKYIRSQKLARVMHWRCRILLHNKYFSRMK